MRITLIALVLTAFLAAQSTIFSFDESQAIANPNFTKGDVIPKGSVYRDAFTYIVAQA